MAMMEKRYLRATYTGYFWAALYLLAVTAAPLGRPSSPKEAHAPLVLRDGTDGVTKSFDPSQYSFPDGQLPFSSNSDKVRFGPDFSGMKEMDKKKADFDTEFSRQREEMEKEGAQFENEFNRRKALYDKLHPIWFGFIGVLFIMSLLYHAVVFVPRFIFQLKYIKLKYRLQADGWRRSEHPQDKSVIAWSHNLRLRTSGTPIPVTAILDSGSDVNLINRKLVVQGNYRVETDPSLNYQTVSGEEMILEDKVTVEWNVLHNFKHGESTFYVAKESSSFQIIFGRDFIEKEGLWVANPKENIFSPEMKRKAKRRLLTSPLKNTSSWASPNSGGDSSQPQESVPLVNSVGNPNGEQVRLHLEKALARVHIWLDG